MLEFSRPTIAIFVLGLAPLACDVEDVEDDVAADLESLDDEQETEDFEEPDALVIEDHAPALQCAHSPCATGGPLQPGCDSCVSAICSVDPFCCNSYWDLYCTSEVFSVCGQTTCINPYECATTPGGAMTNYVLTPTGGGWHSYAGKNSTLCPYTDVDTLAPVFLCPEQLDGSAARYLGSGTISYVYPENSPCP